MIICGIDPGKQGAAVVLYPDNTSAVLRMPIKKDKVSIDGAHLSAWLFAHDVDYVVVEKIGARGHRDKNGKAIRNAGNEFRFAIGVGVIHGCLEALAIKYRKVQPITWKARVLREYGTDKDAAIQYVKDFLPQVDLTPGRCTTPHDGVADAACLAEYGRMILDLDGVD